jgi:hypothetical protein
MPKRNSTIPTAIRANLIAGDVVAWLQQDRIHSLPPLLGTIEADRLHAGDLLLTGVRVRIENDKPASPATANAAD